MLDIGNILKIIFTRFQKEKLTIEECEDELMVAIGQFTLLVNGEGHRAHTVSNADADNDKTNLLRGLIEEFEIRYDSLKSSDFSDSVLITQWLEYISSLPGSSVEMHCYQNDTDYNYKYWYRHIIGEGPVLVGSYIVNSPSNEKGFETGFKVSGTEKKKWTLTVDVKEGIDAVYLCAASLHRKGRCVNVQQNLTPILAKKNSIAEIKCRYDDNSKPYMLWYQQKDTAMVLIASSYGATSDPTYEDGFKKRFKLNRTDTLKGALEISELSASDSAVYYCAVNFSDSVLITQWPEYISSLPGSSVEMHCYQNDTDYDYKYWYQQIKGKARCVKVEQKVMSLFANKNDKTEMECSHDDTSMLNMLWYQQKNTAMVLIGYTYGVSEPTYEDEFKKQFTLKRKDTLNGALEISNLNLTDSAVYYCAHKISVNNANPAYFGKGTKLTVLVTENEVSKRNEINVTIIKPSEKELCKKTVTLVCAAKNFYPDHVSITWTVRGTPRTDGVATDPYATKEKTGNKYTISSRLKVTKKEWNNAKNEFSCILNFYNGTDTWKVPNENQVFGIGGGGYTREDYVKSSQWVKLSYGMVIAKSGLYGLVIFVFVWRKGSHGK
ncbi:uncharacterized protein LOC143746344 [Siphateles boraxobius]|uniref:uncharacterized protein LOC143746344 n=1 Tax=Siphateles boraxobius TaxID=180520 RepID=UPI0040635D4F